LVGAEEERHGVGRPRLVLFPYRGRDRAIPHPLPAPYIRLLDQMKNTMPEPMVSKLFLQMATGMADDYADQMKGFKHEERLDLAKTLLTEEGFSVEWEKTGNQYQIHEITCPYLPDRSKPSEVCTWIKPSSLQCWPCC